MVETTIVAGDVVHDLVKRGKMQVVAKAADSVAEYREEEGFDLADYKTHPLLDVSEDEPVFTCVYLPDSPTTSFNGTYDFPRSRLARVPVEEANEELDRVQRAILRDVFEAMFRNALIGDNDKPEGARETSMEATLRFCIPDNFNDVQEEAAELAELDQQFGGEDSADSDLGDFNGGEF